MLVDLDDKPAQLDIEYAPHPPSPSYDVIFYDLFIALKSYWGFRELSGPRSGIPVQEARVLLNCPRPHFPGHRSDPSPCSFFLGKRMNVRPKFWGEPEAKRLREAVALYGIGDWNRMADHVDLHWVPRPFRCVVPHRPLTSLHRFPS